MNRVKEWHKGRISRLDYFIKSILLVIPFGIFTILTESIKSMGLIGAFMGLIGVVLVIPFIIYGMSLSVRRLHDINLTGWLILLLAIPLINILMGIALTFIKGTDGENKYGKDPLAPLES